jgi:hypothetical protein
MPIFKTTFNIFKRPDQDELFDPNWMNSDKLKLPPGGQDDPKAAWDYNREMTIDDVDIWEVLYEASGGIGVYAAWMPYAEFYMITTGWRPREIWQYVNDKIVETYYGPMAENNMYQRACQLGIPLPVHQKWVDPEDMWLYQPPESNSTIILPNQ